MHVTWRRNVKQERARAKRKPLVWLNSEPRAIGTATVKRDASKPQWHYERARRYAGPRRDHAA